METLVTHNWDLYAHLLANRTLTSLLSSAASLRSLSLSRQLHSLAIKSSPYDLRLHNSLIHLYSSSRHFLHALQVFDRIPHRDRDVVSWTSVISAASNSHRPYDAIRLFDSMQAHSIAPNAATIVSVLHACADLGSLSAVRRAHIAATRFGLASQPNVVTSLVDAYSKCGRIDLAEKIFAKRISVAKEDVFSATAIIAALASHGRSDKALEVFYKMVESGVEPDERTVTAALSACRNSGRVHEGYRIYNNIPNFGMEPRIEHYGCMVDLLARARRLDEAEEFVRRMPIEPDSVMWRSLIWASCFHEDNDRAERLIQERRSCLDNNGGYVLMGNVYASSTNWEAKARVRKTMMAASKKVPGYSRIEVKGIVHEFAAGDSKHRDGARIYQKWEEVEKELRMEGYVPKASEVLLDMEDEEKAPQLQHHSEKLAVAFGLISTKPGEEIMVVKNLRACDDCHDAMKLVSRIYNRRIVIRDRVRFHHFSNGSCSCGDYW